MGRDSLVGIVTHYRLDCPGIESWWGGEIFRTRPERPWGPPSLLYNGYHVFPGAWRCPPTPSGAEVKERVELYLYSPSGPSWPVLGWTLPLLLCFKRLWRTYCFHLQGPIDCRENAGSWILRNVWIMWYHSQSAAVQIRTLTAPQIVLWRYWIFKIRLCAWLWHCIVL
jgi:hypothetical protein